MAKTILVVDDDPDLREAAQIVLNKAGYEVLQAASGKEALDLLKTTRPDLILLDVMMETDTEGFHLAYEIRKDSRFKDVPIVMLTSVEEKTGERIDLEKAGEFLPVQRFLRKPMDVKTLTSTIAQLLAQWGM